MKVELDIDENYKGVIKYLGQVLNFDFDKMCTLIIKNWVDLLKKGLVDGTFAQVLKEFDQ